MEDYKVIRVEPQYDFKNVAGGHFEVYFDVNDDPFKLSFVPFLDHHVRKNDDLFKYLKKTSKDLTVSHAIYDLYDIGFPIDEWVKDYVEVAKENVTADLFNILIKFYNMIKNFNPSGSADQNDKHDEEF